MRICVFGAGAVGGHLAARLAAAGHDVSVVARGAHLEAMRRNGVKLLHAHEVIEGRVRTADPGPQDAIFVTLKANMLGSFADAAAPLSGRATAVVFAQNGIPWWYPADLPRLDPGGKLKEAVPAENVVASGGDTPTTRELRSILEKAGISSPSTEDIRRSVWAKLVQNLANSSLCLLTETAISEVMADPALRELKERISAEARAVAAALGVDIARAPTRPSGGHASGAVGHKPSMLQDYERGRPMEIEAQLMAPLALARAARVGTPTLDVVVPLAAFKAAAKGLYKP
jgi:2-dehydropantoate 2-reductase